MTTTAIFLKQPGNGVCVETEDDVVALLFGDDGEDIPDPTDWIEVTRVNPRGGKVLIPVSNIADVIVGGSHR